jgi:hypothetical protein
VTDDLSRPRCRTPTTSWTVRLSCRGRRRPAAAVVPARELGKRPWVNQLLYKLGYPLFYETKRSEEQVTASSVVMESINHG